MIIIYTDSPVCEWNLNQTNLNFVRADNIEDFITGQANTKIFLYHSPFFESEMGEMEERISQIIGYVDLIIVMTSELHSHLVNFVLRYHNPKIRVFACGKINGLEHFFWMDWFHSSTMFYKDNADILGSLNPSEIKPKFFDILLGSPKPHRLFIKDFINDNNLSDSVIMTCRDTNSTLPQTDSDNWIWENPPVTNIVNTIDNISYHGGKLSLSQVVPIKIYNQSAYSIVTETNYDNSHNFYTEKIVKPILGRRLFIVFAGKHYLKNLRTFGFMTFDGIIDESYDEMDDAVERGIAITKQISFLMIQDQQIIFTKIKTIVDHNYEVMMKTNWHQDFLNKLGSVLQT